MFLFYLGDETARRGINREVMLRPYTSDERYLERLESNLTQAFNEFTPDLIVYNAGTDCLEGDPLGCLSITPNGIAQRDRAVFQAAKDRKIPLVMVTSGGYQRNNARIIADSIICLYRDGLLPLNEG